MTTSHEGVPVHSMPPLSKSNEAPMAVPLRVLIVEDSHNDAALLVRELRRGGYEVSFERVDSSTTMRLALEQQEWDIVICDYSMPGFSGGEALQLLRSTGSQIPFIFLSGTIGEDTAVAALKQGAQDYIMKHNLKRLLPAIQKELREAELIRERDRFERQFRQVQKMEAIGRLAAGVAHDFNNLVMIITSYTAMLMERALSDDVRRYTEQVQQAANRAAALTRQLLAFSRKEETEPTTLDLNILVNDMCNLLPPLLGGSIEMNVVNGPLSGRIKADQGSVEQVLLNLAVNAKDAMPRGGKLQIETSEVELDARNSRSDQNIVAGRYIVLSVTDTGMGMDEKTKARIFEPFFTTKPKNKGTGLGLSTVQEIVKQTGGSISVFSEPGRGSIFEVYFPFVAGTEAPISSVAVDTTPGGDETILLVEDEAALRAANHEFLESKGYRVLEAANGLEALEMCRRYDGPIHVLLTNMIMPGLGGEETARAVTHVHPNLRVVYMSGLAESSQGRRSPDASSAFLEKPFSLASLTQTIRSVLKPGSGTTEGA